MKWRERTPILSDELAHLASLDPHELLGVSENASVEEITRAYRGLIKVYHPDKSDPFMKKHNEEVTKLIISAYQRLVSRCRSAHDG